MKARVDGRGMSSRRVAATFGGKSEYRVCGDKLVDRDGREVKTIPLRVAVRSIGTKEPHAP